MSTLVMPREKVYTVKEVAAWLRVSEKTIRKMIGQGRIDAFLVGDEYRISQSSLDALMRKQAEEKEDQGE